jgi:hypothetical protein
MTFLLARGMTFLFCLRAVRNKPEAGENANAFRQFGVILGAAGLLDLCNSCFCNSCFSTVALPFSTESCPSPSNSADNRRRMTRRQRRPPATFFVRAEFDRNIRSVWIRQ